MGWGQTGQDRTGQDSPQQHVLNIGKQRLAHTCDAPQSRCFLKERTVCPGNVKFSLREHKASVYLVHRVE